MEDFLKIIGVLWAEEDYYTYFNEIGKKNRLKFDK